MIVVHAFALALGLGLAAGLVRTAVEVQPYLPEGALPLFPYLLGPNALHATGVAWLGLGVWWILFGAFRRAMSETPAAIAAFALLAFPVIAAVGYGINKEHLPGFFAWESVRFNLALGLGSLVATALAGAFLGRWGQRVRRGKAPLPRVSMLVAIGILLALFAARPFVSSREGRPNVIVILIDVLRADHLSVYGYERPTSPELEALAADSVVFENAISQSSWTKPSVASLMTGLYPHRHGVLIGNKEDREGDVTSDVLSSDHVTLAEAFRGNDYVTTGWVRNRHLREYLGFGQGFHHYDDKPGDLKVAKPKFEAWLDRMGGAGPFFAYFHLLDLHGPYMPEPPYDTLYGEFSDLKAHMTLSTFRLFIDAVNKRDRPLSEADTAQLIALYDGLITYIDTELGDLFRKLKERNLYDDALIVVLADHGEAFMEHGSITHGAPGYEELIRVPLIVKLPGQQSAGRRVVKQVALIDVMPTLLDWTHAEVPPDLQGRSLAAVLRGEDLAADYPAFIHSERSGSVTLRSDRAKYILRRKGEEYYDLTADPGEQANRAEALSEDLAPLREVARRALEQGRSDPKQRIQMEREDIEALRALGYVE